MDVLLESIQQTMLEMLILFDSICRENGIHYTLHGGTLLGAVRHKGFIPWDDDLDVLMTRNDFNKFCSVWERIKPKGYFLQTKEIEEAYTRSFAKIRKENSLFLQDDENPDAIHTGIFIDIFPADRIPSGKIRFGIFRLTCYLNQLFTREFVPPKSKGIVKIGSVFLLKVTSHTFRMRIRSGLLRYLTRLKDDSELQWAVLETPRTVLRHFPKDFFDSYTKIEFEGCVKKKKKKWDILLKMWFGDYMTLPPEEDRIWKHHPKAVDLESNYHDYLAMKRGVEE